MRAGAVVLVAIAVLGCNLLEVAAPDRVPAKNLADPARAPLLVQSAIADFGCALSLYALATGTLTDELYSSTPFNSNVWDRRMANQSGGTNDCTTYQSSYGLGVYTPLSIARYDGDFAFLQIRDSFPSTVPGRDTLLALAAAYAGFSYTLFGEGFCQGAFDGGPALTQLQTLQRAAQRFDTALSYAEAGGANAESILNLARVGRARVGIDIASKADSLGDGSLAAAERAAAAAEAKLVPQGFVRTASRSQGYARLENAIGYMNYGIEHVSIDAKARNLTVGGVPDPRVQVVNAGHAGNDGQTALWYQLKYTSRSSPIVLASWVEAQLIVAEAEGGQSAVDRINALRSRFTPPLPLFASTDSLTIAKQVVMERRAELFLDGHRIGDRLRLGPRFSVADRTALGLTWETGRTPNKNQTYGTMTCLPLPTLEIDNNDSIP